MFDGFQTFFGNSPSHQSIKNWLTQEAENRTTNISSVYSDYYYYDEQYIKLNCVRKYSLNLYDTILNIPVAEEIASKRTTETTQKFIDESTNNQPLIAITTDHYCRYKRLMNKLGAKH